MSATANTGSCDHAEAWQDRNSPCPVCEALAIAADVCTLDAQATATSFWRTRPIADSPAWECGRMQWGGQYWLSSETFLASTPDEARAKAADWVRAQAPA